MKSTKVTEQPDKVQKNKDLKNFQKEIKELQHQYRETAFSVFNELYLILDRAAEALAREGELCKLLEENGIDIEEKLNEAGITNDDFFYLLSVYFILDNERKIQWDGRRGILQARSTRRRVPKDKSQQRRLV